MKKTAFETLHTQRRLPQARDSECLDEGRNARAVDIRDVGEINDHALRRLDFQHRQKAITKGWRGIDVEATTQTDNASFVTMIRDYLETVGQRDSVDRHQDSPCSFSIEGTQPLTCRTRACDRCSILRRWRSIRNTAMERMKIWTITIQVFRVGRANALPAC